MNRKKDINRFIDRMDEWDSNNKQSYILRLARDRSFFESVFNLVEEGILVIDRKLKIRYFNRAAKDMLSLPDELDDVKVSQLFSGINWRSILYNEDDTWSKIAREELEISYPEHRYIQFYLVPYPGDSALAAIIFRDVTELRSKAINDIENETTKAVSLLAAGVAHEIGNPLNSLYLNLQLLEKNSNGEIDIEEEDSKDIIISCKKEIERLDSIIHRFLNEIKPGDTNFKLLDVRQVIVDTITSMQPEIEARFVEVKCVWGAEAFPLINGDESQLKQAFYNIIRNAIQAMSNGGTLSVFAKFDPNSLTIEFADSGSGITAPELSNIFKAFRTNKPDGNGIGTMIIEKICREHGTDFGLESIANKGTVFYIRFPLKSKRIHLLGDNEK